MKSIPILISLFLFASTLSAEVIICENPQNQNCLKYAKVKNGNGPWVEACCSDFDLLDHQNCEDDCEEPNALSAPSGSNTELPWFDAGQGIQWNITLEDGTVEHHKIEMIGRFIFLDGQQLVAFTNPDISAVIMQLPFTKEEEGSWIKLHSMPIPTYEGKYSDAGIIGESVFGKDKIEKLKNEYKTHLNNSLHIYPNPTQPGYRLQLESKDPILSIELLNSNGQNCISKIEYNGKSIQKTSFRIPDHLENGLYFIKVRIKDREIIKKLMVISP